MMSNNKSRKTMGFFHMLSVNRELNQRVSEIQNKFHRLEDLINGYRGVDERNFNEVNTVISSISRDVMNMILIIDRLQYPEQAALLLEWTDGRKYSWPEWNACASLSIAQAKGFVNKYRPGYYR